MGGFPKNIPWRRFWMPRDTSAPLDQHGYLTDPEGPYGSRLNPHARTLDALEELPCVVLLGEPGSGKSHELAAYWQGLRTRSEGGNVLLLDGRSHRDLDRHLAHAGAFQAWLSGAPLTLLVDSLDEFRAGADEAGQEIRGHLMNGPLDSLRLRIACRAGEWPVALDEQLRQMWNKKKEPDRVGFYRLAPLRRVDVELAVEQGAEKFLGEVAAREVQPLAMSPVTTKDLVRADAEILASGHEACGPVVGAAAAFSEWIRSFNRNIKGLDMESAAVLKVARSRQHPMAALVIRGISDYGDHRKEQLDAIGGGALRKYATRNAVRFLWALLDAGALPHANPR